MATGTGINKKLTASEELSRLIGSRTTSRADATKKIWVYIKKHKLQDEDDKRIIVPDDKFADVFGDEPIHMMSLAKALSKHLG